MKQRVDNYFNNNDRKNKYVIYGDEFKIETRPSRDSSGYVVSIKDYDENQNFESEINFILSNDETAQLASIFENCY